MANLLMYLAFVLFFVLIILIVLSEIFTMTPAGKIFVTMLMIVLIIVIVVSYQKGSDMRKHEIDPIEYHKV